jgi:Spy/CpxP family protein refolding chaperone
MDIFSQNKWLKRTIAFLVVLNLLILALGAWMMRRLPPMRTEWEDFEKASDFLKKELDLTPDQIYELDNIHKDFITKERRLIGAMHHHRDSMNMAMFKNQIDTSLFYDLARRATTESYLSEIYRLEQMQKFRNILTPEQDKKLLSMVDEARTRIFFKPVMDERQRPPRPPNGFTPPQ